MEKRCSLDRLSPFVREVGLQRRDSWRVKPRRIYDHQFLYCVLGGAELMIGDKVFSLSPGDMAIIPPDTPHTLWSGGLEKWELYWFHCDLFYYEDRDWIFWVYNTPERYARLFGGELPDREHIRPDPLFEGELRLPAFVSFEGSGDVEFLFRSLHRMYIRKEPDFAVASKALVLRILNAVFLSAGFYKASDARRKHVSERLAAYIQDNYFRKLSVAEICQSVDYNPDYAGKLFKKEMGMSLIEYLNRVRVERAKRLLLDEDLSIADVAEMTGFASETYFHTVVKKAEGTTPAKIRERFFAIMEKSEV